MAKSKANIPSVSEAVKNIKKGKLLPVYYFFGEDDYNLENSLKAIEDGVKPFLSSEFDREVFYGEEKNYSEIINFAYAFPFGSQKKLIIFKEFEKVKDKKNLVSYLESPPDFTVLVLIHYGSITNFLTEPFESLLKNNFLFEAKELKGRSLVEWLIEFSESKGKILASDNAQMLVDISGENRSMLESQLEKIFIFLGEKGEITREAIASLSTELKEFNIFDLQNALGKKEKGKALNIAFNMLANGAEPTFIIFMLTKYFTGLSRVNEMKEQKIPEQTAARIVGTHPYYYKDYLNARLRFSDGDIMKAVQSLLKAELTFKTTSVDERSLITILITEILQ